MKEFLPGLIIDGKVAVLCIKDVLSAFHVAYKATVTLHDPNKGIVLFITCFALKLVEGISCKGVKSDMQNDAVADPVLL